MIKIDKFSNWEEGAMKNVQGREETPQRTSSNSKHEIFTFLFLWVIFAFLDPDPDISKINADPCESGSTTLFMR
jgi:hypothetical protein